MDHAKRPEYKRLEKQFRKYWLNILETTELNIFHLEKYRRDLNELDKLKI